MKNTKDMACEEKQDASVMEDETLAQVSGMGEIPASKFPSLPLGQLIGPVQQVVDAQEESQKAAKAFLETIGEAEQLKQKEMLLL